MNYLILKVLNCYVPDPILSISENALPDCHRGAGSFNFSFPSYKQPHVKLNSGKNCMHKKTHTYTYSRYVNTFMQTNHKTHDYDLHLRKEKLSCKKKKYGQKISVYYPHVRT